MATTYYLDRDHELSVQAESTYGTDPGAASAGDFFKHKTNPDQFRQVRARYDRDQDRDYNSGSVIEAHEGRKHSEFSIACDVIPSGNASTPTAPDVHVLLKTHFGAEHTATAHTTTTTGSTGTALELTTGGGAASGIQAGDLIAVDVNSTYSYEVRRVVNLATDTVTMDLALSANPATGRTVKVGTTYRYSSTAALSCAIKRWIAGAGKRYTHLGAIVPEFTLETNFEQETPVAMMTFAGRAKGQGTHSDSRPTPTTAGSPLVPSIGRVWVGSTKLCLVNFRVTSNNGRELREAEGCSLQPTGVKFTGNNSRHNAQLELDAFFTTGDEDTAAIYDALIAALTSYSVIIQLGQTPGSIVALCAPAFKPEPELSSRNGEVGVRLVGRCYATNGDDELFLAFI